MVILVTGGNGQLGQALQEEAKKQPEMQFVFTTSKELPITDKAEVDACFKKIKPDYCIHAAAYTAVDQAESEQEKAYEVNVTGTRNIAMACREQKTILLYISTDFVFDGLKKDPYTENDLPNPQTVYGRTKWLAEQEVQSLLSQYYIIRTSWLYSLFGHNFFKTMLKLAEERPEISVVNDQTGSPTLAKDLAKSLLTIIEQTYNKKIKNKYGIYHFCNQGSCTWHDFAKAIFEYTQKKVLLTPISSDKYPSLAKRPAYSVLDTSKIRETFSVPIDTWQDALRKN